LDTSEERAVTEHFDEEFWNERYRSHTALWSGDPNRHLVEEAGELAPGAALDVGAGEGADAIWLARRGWQVTGVDISSVALERAASYAAGAGEDVAERITWDQRDLLEWEPPAARFDLVSAQYLHLPRGPRQALFDRLAQSVAIGGTLLIVGHHPSDMQTTMPRPKMPELFFSADEISERLDPASWQVVTNAAAAHSATDPEGRSVTIHDTVLRARRLA
jgi:SAM-dependent methyltransferase